MYTKVTNVTHTCT